MKHFFVLKYMDTLKALHIYLTKFKHTHLKQSFQNGLIDFIIRTVLNL